MTSRTKTSAFVWAHLPGDTHATVCGRFDHEPTAEGRAIGTFVYARSFVENAHAQAIDPLGLPLSARRFETAALNGVFGVIADAVPDDWGRYVIDRRHGTQSYPTGYLLRTLDDAVGHLSFSSRSDEAPSDGGQEAPPSADLLDDVQRIVSGLETGQPVPPELADRVRVNTGMGGARPKLTVLFEGEQWLAKFASSRDDRRFSNPRLEAAMLDLAARCGIESVEARVVQAAGADVLLVKRFDRKAARGGAGWLRDAYLSARCVFSANPANAYSFGGSYLGLARDLGRLCFAHAASARQELFRRMVFNCLVSNTDDHDRNHGFIADEDPNAAPGQYRLAPAFDIVPRLHETRRREQAMLIGEHGSTASVENLVSASQDFGFETEAAAKAVVARLSEAVSDQWRGCLQQQGLDPQALTVLSRCFEPLPQR